MSVTELLLQAKKKKADEFLFIVGCEPRVRMAEGWESLRSSPALLTEWKLLLQSFLSSQQKTILDELGRVQGEVAFENVRIGFSFYQDQSMMKALFDLNLDGKDQELLIPPALIENCLRLKGLVLLTSPGETGQVWALHKILQKMTEEKNFLGVVFSPKAFPQLKEKKGCFVYHTGDFKNDSEKDSLLAGVDVVIYDSYADDSTFEQAIAAAERGLFVIYSMKAPTVTNALRRALTVVTEKFGTFGAPRLAEMLTLVAGSYPFSSLSGDKIFAHEFLLAKPQVRQWIEQSDIKNIENLLLGTVENPGILTLNQSLLQHLIRRRTDLKTAFGISRDPDNLDQLLKKVGI